jgi:hypothetical protein
MNIYIWHYIEKCTENYHSGGGVVAFAYTLDEAIEHATKAGCSFKETEKPDYIRQCEDGEPRVFIMPDAGCC